MIPGTRVRIHYPGDVKHNAIGTVVSIRKVGSMKEHTVNLEKPLRISGFKPITRIYVTASRLRKLADAPKEQPQVVWQGEPPKPKRATVSNETAAPYDIIPSKDGAEMLGIHINSFTRLIRNGKIRAWKLGKSWAVSEADVLAMAETYESRTGPKSWGSA